jgi:uncharacterized metal-binding protein YceD (DUF177 family)
MSAMPVPEFSRRVSLARLGPEPFRQRIEADKTECAALARRFDLVAVDRLTAQVELVRQGPDRILLNAAFDAEFVQSCVVTLDPVAGAVAEHFTLLYGPPELEETGIGGIEDEAAFEPLIGDAIDIGEAVTQEFALALPPFPRSADADGDAVLPAAEEPGPFAELARLVGRDGGR